MDPSIAELIWLDHTTQAAVPSIETLRNLLPQLLSGFESTVLIIDGIDELPEHKISSVLQTLLKFVKSQECSLKLLISSRDKRTIQQRLRGAIIVPLDE